MTTSLTQISLRSLPTPKSFFAGDRLPWSLVNTRELAGMLGADPCQVSMWVYRGKGPPSLPPHWFKGRVRAFRLSAVSEWLATAAGASELEWIAWRRALADHFVGKEALAFNEEATRRHSAQVLGLLGQQTICPAGATWKPGGFRSYVDTVLGQSWRGTCGTIDI